MLLSRLLAVVPQSLDVCDMGCYRCEILRFNLTPEPCCHLLRITQLCDRVELRLMGV